MPTSRRRTILGLGGLLAAGGAVVSTGAFDTVEAERSVGVETAGDASAFLGLEPAPDQDIASFDDNDLVEFDLGVIPVGSRVTHSELVHATNQGTQTVTSLKFEFLVDSPDTISGGDDHQDDEDVAEALRIVSENDDGDIFEIDAEDDENLIQTSDAGDAGNNELAPGEYIPFGIRVDLNDAPIDEISGAQDITLRIIAESGEVEDDNGGSQPGTPPFVYVDGPDRSGRSVSFDIEYTGTGDQDISGFNITFPEMPGNSPPPEVFDFDIDTPEGEIDGESVGVGDDISHESYNILPGESASYTIEDLDRSVSGGRAELDLTIITLTGERFDLAPEEVE